MKALWSDWWAQRTRRERLLLGGGAALALLAIWYWLLIVPALEAREQLREEIPLRQAQLAAMRAEADDAQRLRPRAAGAAPAGDALREALNTSLNQRGFDGARLNVAGIAVQAEFKRASFGALVAWLDEARRQFRVRVATAQISALENADEVSAKLTLAPVSDNLARP